MMLSNVIEWIEPGQRIEVYVKNSDSAHDSDYDLLAFIGRCGDLVDSEDFSQLKSASVYAIGTRYDTFRIRVDNY